MGFNPSSFQSLPSPNPFTICYNVVKIFILNEFVSTFNPDFGLTLPQRPQSPGFDTLTQKKQKGIIMNMKLFWGLQSGLMELSKALLQSLV